MAKQFMDPSALQPGVANNFAANAIQSMQENPSVMEGLQEQLGSQYTMDYITKRLEKLDNIEEAAAVAHAAVTSASAAASGSSKKKKKNKKN